MTWETSGESQWPPPFVERKGSLGKLVREYVQDTEEKGGDDAGYERLRARTAPTVHRRHRRNLILTAGLAAIAGLATTSAILRHRAPSRPAVSIASPSATARVVPPARAPAAEAALPPVQSSAAPPGSTPKGDVPRAASVHLQKLPATLPAGNVDLDGQALAVLSTDAAASARTAAGNTEIVLGKGDIELHVLPRAPGHGFSVRAGPYQFTVMGTVFAVSQTRSRLELVVREGTVAVSRGSQRLATVVAGGKWAVELDPTSTPAASPSPAPPAVLVPPPAATLAPSAEPVNPPAPAPPTPADCRQLAASQRPSEALLCYQAQTAKGGLAGETAQYELGRLWRDSFGNLERALAAFQEQRARFPSGALRIEADLSIIELLPRLGRHDEAMTETEGFLADHPRAERRGEIRLLRGNILREVRHDLGRAEREYAEGGAAGGRAGDDCRFLRAVCLEALGRLADAREAYEAYLLGSKTGHAPEVKQRLERLRP